MLRTQYMFFLFWFYHGIQLHLVDVLLCSYSVYFFFSSRRRHTRCLSDWSSDVCSSDLVAPAGMEGMGIRSGVHLAHCRPDPVGGIDLALVGIDEHADHDPGFGEAGDDALQRRLAPHDIEAALGRDLLAAFGNEHRHLRPDAARDADHLLGRRHLEVELDVRELAQTAHVLVLDVPPVLAQVDGDAGGAAEVRP